MPGTPPQPPRSRAPMVLGVAAFLAGSILAAAARNPGDAPAASAQEPEPGGSGSAPGDAPAPFFSADTTLSIRIHDSLPPYHFTLIHDLDTGLVGRILVTRGDEEAPLQTLSGFPQPEPPPGGRADFQAMDVNFDGYLDLRLLAMSGATGNRAYLWWLFDPSAGAFVYEPALLDLGNPVLNPEARTVHTRATGGMAGQVYTEGTYRWEADRPVLVRQVRQQWNQGRRAFARVVEERTGDSMVPVRHGIRFEAEVTEGERFTFDLTDRLYFELDPDPSGWEIAVRTPDRPGENLARLTPPFHGPNPRFIEGWHFRNADNTGPNDGSVNAPQRERAFIFSERVGRTIQGPGSVRGPSEADLEAVRRDGEGVLTIEDLRLVNLEPGQKAQVQWMRFVVDVETP